ncbi:hypothetical protein [Streptomyces sp. SAJ15]|uniref:hypothetical protein n=1 Tax=Streptomyces sp. SAJ15 TaxID=2011095 RepID=UPI001643692D|nr:hypothetical protein [Streptomyces sp. SAJ15]
MPPTATAAPLATPRKDPGSLRRAAPALALYAATRLTGMVCMAAWAWWIGKHPRTLLGFSWDGMWYTGIARYGYGVGFPVAGGPHQTFSDLAFFPLLPGLVRAVATITPLGAVSAGLLVAWVAAGFAAWGIYAIGELLYGRRVATLLVVLWGVLPHAIVQSMVYTEPLMTALAAWSLYALLTRRWLWAGALALLAGVSRPSGVAVPAAVCVCAAVELWRGGRAGRRRWRVWAAAAVAPLGWLGYVAWVGVQRGGPLGYFKVQEEWGSHFDFGIGALRYVRHLLIGQDLLAAYMVPVIVAAALVCLALLVLDRPPLALLVYTLALTVIALGGDGYFPSKPRFLLPAFPLLLPAALAMARARRRTVLVTVGALAGLSWCYGTYLLTVAPIPM